MNPRCPKCGKSLVLKTFNYQGVRDSGLGMIMYVQGDFYVCKPCKIHWPRSAVISMNTKRDGVRPRKRA